MVAILGTPIRLLPLSVSANGYLDSGSPMRGYVVIPTVTTVSSAIIKLAFRQFMAPATAASSGGSATSGTGGHTHWWGIYVDDVPPARTKRDYLSGDGTVGVNIETGSASSLKTSFEAEGDHAHSVPAHTHNLTYGTYEEAYPASHSVKVKTYELVAGVWTLRNTSAALTTDQASIDLTSIITGAGDWRFEILSDAAQPNGGRLGCDLYGTFELIV